jgi:hypothetical protein
MKAATGLKLHENIELGGSLHGSESAVNCKFLLLAFMEVPESASSVLPPQKWIASSCVMSRSQKG